MPLDIIPDTIIALLHLAVQTNGHVVQFPPYWMARYTMGHPKQRNAKLD